MFIKGNYISLSNGDFHILVLFVGSILGAYTLSCLGSIYPFQKAKVKLKDRRISVQFFKCEHMSSFVRLRSTGVDLLCNRS